MGLGFISGDSTKIYRFNNGEVTECKAFSNLNLVEVH